MSTELDRTGSSGLLIGQTGWLSLSEAVADQGHTFKERA